MASIIEKRAKDGSIQAYMFRACLGRDEMYKQVFRNTTIPRPQGLTPAKEKKEVKRLAAEWEKQQREDYEVSRSKVDKTKITLAAFVNEHWLPDHVHDGKHSPSSIAFYESMAQDILGYFKNTKLESVNAEAVKRYVRYLSTKATTRSGERLSKTTVNRHYQTLRNIVNYAIRFDYMKDDPFRRLSVSDKPGNTKKDIDFLSPQDAARFMAALESEPLYWQCFENLLITTGIRRGEAVGLQWGDIDQQSMMLSICRNVTLDKDSPNGLHIGLPKNKETRRVPLSQRVLNLLAAYKLEQKEKYGGADLLPTAFIFCTPENPYQPITPPAATRWQARFVERHHLPKVSPHDLRHTAATLALESGATMKQVQQLLGHADPSTTLRFYSGVTEEAERRTVQGIESILAQGGK